MAVYGVVELEITDVDAMAPYVEGVAATIAAHGGRYLVKAGATDVVEGDVGLPTKVILEFPSKTAAQGWYDSKEYQELLPYRRRNSRGNLIWVEGV